MKASPDDGQVPCPPLPDPGSTPARHGPGTVPTAPGVAARNDVVLAARDVPRPAEPTRAPTRPVGFRIGKAMFVHLPHDGCATCGRDFGGQFARTRGHFRPRRATDTFPAELRHDRTMPHHQSRYWSRQCAPCNARQGNHR